MTKKKLRHSIFISVLALSLLISSFGGTYASTVLAAAPEQAQDTGNGKGIVGGLIAIGLLAMLSGHNGSSGSPAPEKTSTPVQTTKPQTQTVPTTSNPPSQQNTGSNSSTVSSSSNGLTAEEQKAFDLLNNDRKANGLAPLIINSSLVNLAENHAQDMINRHFFAHNNPDGQTPFDRMTQAGIRYSYAGENLAINTSVPNAEVAFMNSPGHRANILNSHYTDVGLGVKHGSNGSVYVVQEFISH